MSTMMNAVLRNKIKSHRPLGGLIHYNQRLSLFPPPHPRRFSTVAEIPAATASATNGLVYGKLFGVAKHTTKGDIINLLEGCNVRVDDIKVGYNRAFSPLNMVIKFFSQKAYDAANRAINRKGRNYRLDMADRSQWDFLLPYDGKAILLQGIPRSAQYDDIENFLSGCPYDSSTIQIFSRRLDSDYELIRMAVAHFPSRAQAMHAFLTKNGGFCQNGQILVRILH